MSAAQDLFLNTEACNSDLPCEGECSSCGQEPCVCEKPSFPCFVNVYDVALAWGGSEEGGWWYTAGSPEESVKVHSQEQLDRVLAEKRAEYELDENGEYLYKDQWDHPNFDRSRNRRLGDVNGFAYEIRVEKHFAQHFPQERPHYE